MAFPIAPSINDVYVNGGVQYKWNGYAWDVAANVGNASMYTYEFVAMAGQTAFNVGYYAASKYVDVWLNGVKLSAGEYVADTGSTVVLTTGATVGDIVCVKVYDAITMADTIKSVSANTLGSGSAATVSYVDGALTFGIPSGPQGIQGETGPKGDKGDTGDTGATGKGIATIVRTSGDGSAGTTDTYTVTYTDATTTTFNVYNGADGAIQDISGKQDTLVSGTNIKTVGGTSLLGSGNITLPTATIVNNTLTSTSTTEALSAAQGKALQDGKQNTLVSGTSIKTINGASVLGSGDIVVGGGGGGFTYMEASNPLTTTNASLNDLWFNTTTMELFICRDATVDANVWEGDGGTNVDPIPPTQAYGVEWNQTTDVYTRTGLAVGTANSTSYAGSLQVGMRRCVLNANGTVNYYLHPTDSTKKADGSAAVIDGSAGNVMVEIPKFYYKYEYAAPVHKWSISPLQEAGYTIHPAFVRGGVEQAYRYYCAYEGYNNGGTLISRSGVLPTASQTIATFRTQARANGTGWSLIDWNLLYAVQMLFLTEYADFDTQAMIGNGNNTGSDYAITTGQSNAIGNASSPATNDNMWMSYRGIENWYGSMYKFIDGVNVNERVVYVNSNPATFASDVFTGDYVSTGASFPSVNGYVNGLNNSSKGFIANAATGTDSTFIPDYVYSYTGARIVLFGGDANSGLVCGGFLVAANNAASDPYAWIGSGVAR